MRPLRIEMKGFSAFRERTEIDLTDVDLVALVGSTGSGKSTIIDAITFALYGSVARYEDNRAVAPVINQTSNEARVALTFELNGDEHVAVRVVRRTKKGATTKETRLERGEEMLASDARSMSKTVEELLGLDMDQFNRTVVLPQGRFADFLHDDPAKRQATMRQLLGLDVYERIGKAARARAKELQVQADLLRDDLDSASQELTDENRVALASTVSNVNDLRKKYEVARAAVDDLIESRRSFQEGADRAARDMGLLDGVSQPAGLAELDSALAAATEQARKVTEAIKLARQARKSAKAAVETGPDPTETRLRLRLYTDLDSVTEKLDQVRQQVANLEATANVASETAVGVRQTQAALDATADAAHQAVDKAKQAAAELPSIVQLDAWIDQHTMHEEDRKRAATASEEAARTTEPIDAAELAAADAASVLDGLEVEVAMLKERIGIAAYASNLAVGEECPLCLQKVHSLPDHHVDDELAGAERRRQTAATTLKEQRAVFDRLRSEANRADAALRSVQDAVVRSERAVGELAAVDELRRQRVEAERLAGDAQRAENEARAAVTAATAHRADDASKGALEDERRLMTELAGVRGELVSTTQRLEALRSDLVDVPSQADCERLLAESEELAEALRLADDAERSAEQDQETSAVALSELQAQLDDARRQLSSARDEVASLGPPPVDGATIADDWMALIRWIDEQRQRAASTGEAARAELERIEGEISAITEELQEPLRSVLGNEIDGVQFARLGETLAAGLSSAESELAAFDVERKKLGDLRERIDGLDEQQAVAKTLGHLLRSDGFEGWLMQSALEALAARATTRLFEMSGSQYSLVLEDRAFSVRDHANADELRSARTLSGGETFLASLSLALALAESTAELAPEGAPQIESIFLDEGFGTLDPNTLDIVASAIEELGASGRMVGIVTHIRELAERMPVRLEVSKAGGSSSVERVEV